MKHCKDPYQTTSILESKNIVFKYSHAFAPKVVRGFVGILRVWRVMLSNNV